jgi:hypothetical protein
MSSVIRAPYYEIGPNIFMFEAFVQEEYNRTALMDIMICGIDIRF